MFDLPDKSGATFAIIALGVGSRPLSRTTLARLNSGQQARLARHLEASNRACHATRRAVFRALFVVVVVLQSFQSIWITHTTSEQKNDVIVLATKRTQTIRSRTKTQSTASETLALCRADIRSRSSRWTHYSSSRRGGASCQLHTSLHTSWIKRKCAYYRQRE